ncbi:type II secretion system protein [Rugosibacter aromaticivorans]|uniref:type II secretion system protein n=1 Tax=Rugosibacter aromaticivorans TaxID=1565605 RepID=UPI00120DF532|nr:prepilin-type N-terminal cleavage/methylation domain-containing protein [Rugosibacter aromaticivorans]TBR14219.1 MAG: prepilin-type N-terminal cleavage/methylation domain-containing protein [Rugosibacter sp.]
MKLADSSAPSRWIPLRIAFHQRGFTLVELAIVMFIVALLLGGMLLPLSAQQDMRNQGDTQKQLAEAREALLGFAIANGRLPCPASGTSNGMESPAVGGACTNPYDGFLPAASLGLAPIDAQGYAVDGWGGNPINRIRYAVTTANASAFTTANGMKTVTMTGLAPDLKVCNAGSGVVNPGTLSADCTAVTSLAADAVAVIYSVGKNAGTGGNGPDEKHNPNPNPAAIAADRVFVSTQPSPNFDDQMIWLSKNILFNRMVSAGQLP